MTEDWVIDIMNKTCPVCQSKLVYGFKSEENNQEVIHSRKNNQEKSPNLRDLFMKVPEETELIFSKINITNDFKSKESPVDYYDASSVWEHEYEEARKERKEHVHAHISQLLPIKATLQLIAKKNIDNKSNKFLLYTKVDNKWKKSKELCNLIEELSLIRFALFYAEIKNQHIVRGTRPSAGFPSHRKEPSSKRRNEIEKIIRRDPDVNYDSANLLMEEWEKTQEEKSHLRFLNTVIGGRRETPTKDNNRILFGALFTLGFAIINPDSNDSEVYLSLTDEGDNFSRLKNPLLNGVGFNNILKHNLMKKFSEEEAEFFFKHTKEKLTREWVNLVAIHKIFQRNAENPLHVKQITNALMNESYKCLKSGKKRTPHGWITMDDSNEKNNSGDNLLSFIEQKNTSPNPRQAYVSSLLNRWCGLGIFQRSSRGYYEFVRHESLYEEILSQSKKIEETFSSENPIIEVPVNKSSNKPSKPEYRWKKNKR